MTLVQTCSECASSCFLAESWILAEWTTSTSLTIINWNMAHAMRRTLGLQGAGYMKATYDTDFKSL